MGTPEVLLSKLIQFDMIPEYLEILTEFQKFLLQVVIFLNLGNNDQVLLPRSESSVLHCNKMIGFRHTQTSSNISVSGKVELSKVISQS